MDPPESLEKIFLRVEEESLRRAKAEDNAPKIGTEDITKPKPLDVQKLAEVKARRRGSVSITRFGQLADDLPPSKEPPSESDSSLNSPPKSPTIITALAAQSTFYQSQLLNSSHDSLASHASDEERHVEDDNHVTQIHRIAARQTLTRTVGSLLPRRMSRARSRPVIEDNDGTLVIGVSVQAAATVVESSETDLEEVPVATVITAGNSSLSPSLNSKASRSSLRSTSSNNNWGSNGGWVTRARDFTRKLRRKSVQPLTQTSA